MKKRAFLVVLASVWLTGCSPMPTPNFQQMTLPKFPNYFLACPPNYCNVLPTATSPVYPVSAEDLFNTFNQLVAKESYVNFTYSMPEQGQFTLVASSGILHLPDDIAVQFIALSENTSTLVIYSKSRYGFYDFGTNKRRVTQWLSALSVMTAQKPAAVS
jgi:hypothetical protein